MRRGALAVGLLLLLAAPAWGGNVGGMVSYWSTDEADDDTGLGLKLDVDLGARVDLELRAAVFDSFVFPESVPEFEIEATTVDLGLGYDFPLSRATPYVGFGLSYVLFNVDLRPPFTPANVFKGRLQDEAGWYALAGVEAPIGRRFEFFVEAFYRQLEGRIQGDDLGSLVELGIDFSGPGANLGVQLAW